MENNNYEKWMKGLTVGLALAGGMAAAIKGISELVNPTKEIRLKDKVILITGGGRGLGLILARKLADYGAAVAICGRSEETLRQASKEISARTDTFLAIPCDITDKQQVEQMIKQIKEKIGSIDVLINNAGIIGVGPMESMSQSDYEEAIKTHFWGPFYLINEVLPDMKDKEGGNIVNIASVGSKVSFPHLLPYNVSKYALSGFSEGIAAELSKYNIIVTTVYPGLMRTGSPRNIDVKGQYAKEYAWFKLADSLPFISMDADRAADKVIEAFRQGKRTVTFSGPAKLAVAAHGIAPGVTIAAFNLFDMLLPATRERKTTQKKKGYESKSKVSESSFTDKTDEAAHENLEM